MATQRTSDRCPAASSTVLRVTKASSSATSHTYSIISRRLLEVPSFISGVVSQQTICEVCVVSTMILFVLRRFLPSFGTDSGQLSKHGHNSKRTSKELLVSATASWTATPFLRAGQYAKDRTLCLLRTTCAPTHAV